MNRLVLIDRDGTINVERNYLSAPEQIELIPQAAEAIEILRRLNLKLAVITNQSGIGRGYFDRAQLDKIHARLHEVLQAYATDVDAVYFCPHAPEENCRCRKPLSEMATRAAKDFGAKLSESFVIGDNVCDIELGKNIGATTILVRTGHGQKVEQEQAAAPDYTVDDLLAAAYLIESILEKNDSDTE